MGESESDMESEVGECCEVWSDVGVWWWGEVGVCGCVGVIVCGWWVYWVLVWMGEM